jgi:hypothetical protein
VRVIPADGSEADIHQLVIEIVQPLLDQ